ncbi:unnamed protein product [Mytilus coruscus]|uniref:Uncharacterized protein n=1 Tax=Mytilus coruscus TaxID=42192 RepID=A0A6J8E7P8_MYTCO|nr:unnamed protein product [Mytilus coruscus]
MKEETRGVDKAIEVYSFNQLLDQQLTTLTESATGYTPQHNPLIFQRTNAPNFQLNTQPPQQVSFSTLSTTPVLSRQYIVNRPSLTIYSSPSNLGCSNFTGSIVCITNESATPVYTSSVTQWNESGTAEVIIIPITLSLIALFVGCYIFSDGASSQYKGKESCIVVHIVMGKNLTDEALSDFLRHAPHQAGGLKYKYVQIFTGVQRTVPIILTTAMINKLDKLMELRVNEHITSKYNFSRPVPSLKTYRGSDVLREIKGIVCLKQPEAFTFTALKNHITTLTQLYEMNNTMQDLLAQFLGHDIRDHRKFYWLPLDIIQEAKVSKFLIDGSEGKKQDFVNLHIKKDVKISY